jgi:hypothetical protein
MQMVVDLSGTLARLAGHDGPASVVQLVHFRLAPGGIDSS